MAWSSAGGGPGAALVICSGWVSHLQQDWRGPEIGAFHQALARHRRLVRYDRPGVGLADRHAYDFSLEGELDHLGRVIDASGEPSVALLGRSFSGPVAMAFAARHPQRVSQLVLFGTSAPIIATPDFPEGVSPGLADAMEMLVLAEWGTGSRAVTAVMLPHVAPEIATWYAEYERNAASATVAVEIIRSRRCVEIDDVLSRIRVPTLFIHRRDDRAVTLAAARRTAAKIPGARLHVLEGSENLPFFGDRESVVRAITGFLDPVTARLTARELEILRRLADGLSNRAISKLLCVSEHTVARHVANIFLKLDVGSRTAAVAKARQAGLIS